MADDLFAKRQSVRSFKPDEVSGEIEQRLLQAAIDAPSAGNCQPWHFYVVKNRAVRARLCAAAWNQRFIEAAPLLIAVCAEPARSAERYGERGETLYCIQDTAAAIENILLCAADHGLGSCWCGAFDEAAVASALGLPSGRRPVALLAIGHPEARPTKPPRRPLDEVATILE